MGGTSAKELWLTIEDRWTAPKEILWCSADLGAGVNVCGEWGNLTGVGRLDLRAEGSKSLSPESAGERSTLSLFMKDEVLALDDIMVAGFSTKDSAFISYIYRGLE